MSRDRDCRWSICVTHVRAAAVAVLGLAALALAEDPPKAAMVDLGVPARWTAGEVVTHVRTRTSKAVTRSPVKGSSAEKTTTATERDDVQYVVRCDEAGADGAFVKGAAFVVKWRFLRDGATDRCLEGLHLDLADGAATLVGATAKVSDPGRTWLDAEFAGGRPDRLSAASAFGAGFQLPRSEPVVSRTAEATTTARIVQSAPTPDGPSVTVESRIEATRGYAALQDGSYSATTVRRSTGVPAVWHRTGTSRSDIGFEISIRSVLGGRTTKTVEERTESQSKPGGTVPAREKP